MATSEADDILFTNMKTTHSLNFSFSCARFPASSDRREIGVGTLI